MSSAPSISLIDESRRYRPGVRLRHIRFETFNFTQPTARPKNPRPNDVFEWIFTNFYNSSNKATSYSLSQRKSPVDEYL